SRIDIDPRTTHVPRSEAFLVLRYRGAGAPPTADQYAKALGLFVDGFNDPNLPQTSEMTPRLAAYLWRNHLDQPQGKRWQEAWEKEKLTELEMRYRQRDGLVAQTLLVDPGSEAEKALVKKLTSLSDRFRLLPERTILLNALKMGDTAHREQYVKRELG